MSYFLLITEARDEMDYTSSRMGSLDADKKYEEIIYKGLKGKDRPTVTAAAAVFMKDSHVKRPDAITEHMTVAINFIRLIKEDGKMFTALVKNGLGELHIEDIKRAEHRYPDLPGIKGITKWLDGYKAHSERKAGIASPSKTEREDSISRLKDTDHAYKAVKRIEDCLTLFQYIHINHIRRIRGVIQTLGREDTKNPIEFEKELKRRKVSPKMIEQYGHLYPKVFAFNSSMRLLDSIAEGDKKEIDRLLRYFSKQAVTYDDVKTYLVPGLEF